MLKFDVFVIVAVDSIVAGVVGSISIAIWIASPCAPVGRTVRTAVTAVITATNTTNAVTDFQLANRNMVYSKLHIAGGESAKDGRA